MIEGAAAMARLPLALVLCCLPAGAADYVVACGRGSDAGSGAAPEEAWERLAPLGRVELGPGDRILLRRGTVCRGPLKPRGGGRAGLPAVIEAWGEGSPPVVDGAAESEAVRLWNQSHWRIRGIAARGGTEFGIHVSGDSGVLRGIELVDVIAEDVRGPLKTKVSGLSVVAESARAQYGRLGLEVAEVEGPLEVRLHSPGGERVMTWSGYASAVQVIHTLRRHCGEPRPPG